MSGAKILLLPSCLEQSLAHLLISEAADKGYEANFIRKGSEVKKILENHLPEGIEKIVGVVCAEGIDLVRAYLAKRGFYSSRIFPAILSEGGNGCMGIDVEEILQAL